MFMHFTVFFQSILPDRHSILSLRCLIFPQFHEATRKIAKFLKICGEVLVESSEQNFHDVTNFYSCKLI